MSKMIKTLWVLSLSLFLFSCATAVDTGSEPETVDNSKTVTAETAEKEPVWVTVTVDEFFVSQETIKYDDGFIDGYRLYDYSDSGLLMKKTHIGSDESIISEELFLYNGDDLLTKSQFFSGGEEISYSEYTYNEKKQLIEESYFNPRGELLAVSTYEYDADGNRTKWISGDSGGIPMMYTEYEYRKGMLVQMNYHMPNGEMEGFTQLEYDGETLVQEATYNASSKLEKKTEYIIENGQIRSMNYYSGSNIIRTVEFEYDDAGNAVIERTKNRRGDIIDIIEKEYAVFSVEKTVRQ